MKTRKLKYKLVDTAGQITAVIIDGLNNRKLSSISRQLMDVHPNIEQVALLTHNKNSDNYELKMMGNELSINGSLAGAFLLNRKSIRIDALKENINFKISKNYITGYFPKNIIRKVSNNLIDMEGISFIISNNKSLKTKKFLRSYTYANNLKALGLIEYNKNEIKPLIYVRQTNSLVSETACGSGSLAYSLYSELSEIEQPSGGYITINQNKDSFTIKVAVKIVN